MCQAGYRTRWGALPKLSRWSGCVSHTQARLGFKKSILKGGWHEVNQMAIRLLRHYLGAFLCAPCAANGGGAEYRGSAAGELFRQGYRFRRTSCCRHAGHDLRDLQRTAQRLAAVDRDPERPAGCERKLHGSTRCRYDRRASIESVLLGRGTLAWRPDQRRRRTAARAAVECALRAESGGRGNRGRIAALSVRAGRTGGECRGCPGVFLGGKRGRGSPCRRLGHSELYS